MPKFIKGQSGNPRGRPPKSRTLSNILAQKAEDLMPDNSGEYIAQQQLIADLIWQFITTGEVHLPAGTLRAENVTDWLNAVRWLYTHVDGLAPNLPENDNITILIERVPPLLTDETDN